MQCALLLLRYCAVPRFSHVLRALPPNIVATAASAHHEAIMNCLSIFLAMMTPCSAGTRLSPLRVMPPTKLPPLSLANRLHCHSVSEALVWSTLAAYLMPPS